MDAPKPILVLCRDLMFVSKITSAAEAIGVTVQVIRDPQKLSGIAGDAMMVDLNQEGFLEAAAAWKRQNPGRLTGFVSHVQTDTVARAREAGFDQVIPRGAFNARLREILLNSAAGTSSIPDRPSEADKV